MLRTFANSLVLSKILYALPVFATVRTGNDDPLCSYMKKLQIPQNRLARLCLGVKRIDKVKITTFLNRMDWLSVNQLAARGILLEYIKMKKQDILNRLSNHGIHTRFGNINTGEWSIKPTNPEGFFANALKVWKLVPKQLCD